MSARSTKHMALRTMVVLFMLARPASAQTPTPPLPLTISVHWDSAPHSLSTARNLDTLYRLYGRGVDGLFVEGHLDRGKTGVVARLLRMPLDAYVAWLVTLTGHEFGHCQQAWLGGSRECHWVPAPGPYALGHIISIGDPERLSQPERQAVTAGGTQASVAAADVLKRDFFLAGRADWTVSPLMVFRQLDISLYGLTSPSPDEAGPDDYANDMTNYAARYGARSGRGGQAVHESIVNGALWNAADPMTWLAAYSYFAGYVAHGERTAQAPGLTLAGRRWMTTTNAWLSEVGVRYSLAVLSRGAAGDMIEVTPSWGENQPAMNVRWSRDVRPGLRAIVSGDLWRQRASASPGSLETGGSFGGGLSVPAGRFRISGDVGYKSAGVMLAQPQRAGWFFSIGGAIRVGR